MDMDDSTKQTVLNVAPSVVSIITRSGGNIFFRGSGTIINSYQTDQGQYSSTILSSARLVVAPGTTVVAENLNVKVYLHDNTSYQGNIIAVDPHFNIIFLSILSGSLLPAANISRLNDSMEIINPRRIGSSSFELRPRGQSKVCHIKPGDDLIAIAVRRHQNSNVITPTAGQFSIQCLGLDCNEVFRMTYKMKKFGVGGPIISRDGDVIGIAFMASCSVPTPPFTPFLPINVALLWWKRYEENKGLCPPELGMDIANLYTAECRVLDRVRAKFPHVSKGVIVEQVRSGSSADLAGICVNDIIVECSGSTVGSVLQLFELAWGNAGELLDLVIIRLDEVACLRLSLVLSERAPHEINRWPFPEITSRKRLGKRRRL